MFCAHGANAGHNVIHRAMNGKNDVENGGSRQPKETTTKHSRGLQVTFNKLCYTVPLKKKKSLAILKNLAGAFQPGQAAKAEACVRPINPITWLTAFFCSSILLALPSCLPESLPYEARLDKLQPTSFLPHTHTLA
eukprot:5963822-Pleurochrysis_carterae.AAC.1